jgi:hypothetical protein
MARTRSRPNRDGTTTTKGPTLVTTPTTTPRRARAVAPPRPTCGTSNRATRSGTATLQPARWRMPTPARRHAAARGGATRLTTTRRRASAVLRPTCGIRLTFTRSVRSTTTRRRTTYRLPHRVHPRPATCSRLCSLAGTTRPPRARAWAAYSRCRTTRPSGTRWSPRASPVRPSGLASTHQQATTSIVVSMARTPGRRSPTGTPTSRRPARTDAVWWRGTSRATAGWTTRVRRRATLSARTWHRPRLHCRPRHPHHPSRRPHHRERSCRSAARRASGSPIIFTANTTSAALRRAERVVALGATRATAREPRRRSRAAQATSRASASSARRCKIVAASSRSAHRRRRRLRDRHPRHSHPRTTMASIGLDGWTTTIPTHAAAPSTLIRSPVHLTRLRESRAAMAPTRASTGAACAPTARAAHTSTSPSMLSRAPGPTSTFTRLSLSAILRASSCATTASLTICRRTRLDVTIRAMRGQTTRATHPPTLHHHRHCFRRHSHPHRQRRACHPRPSHPRATIRMVCSPGMRWQSAVDNPTTTTHVFPSTRPST